MKKILLSFMLFLILLGGTVACSSNDLELENQKLRDDIQKMQIQLGTLYNYDDELILDKIKEIENSISNITQYDETDILYAIDALESELLELQTLVGNMTLSRGLNERVSVYINKTNELMSMSNNISKIVHESFDISGNAPDYIKDVDGNYITFEELGGLLKLKYFGVEANQTDDRSQMGSKADFVFKGVDGMSGEETLARMIILIQEFKNYDFYILSCSSLNVKVYSDSWMIDIEVPLAVIINEYFDITLDAVINEEFETNIIYTNITIDQVSVQSNYDTFITNSTFDGYVLNYTP